MMKSAITTLMLGALIAEFGITGISHEDGSAVPPEAQAQAVMEKMIPVSANASSFGVSSWGNLEISADVDAGVRHLDRSVRQVPGYAVKVAQQVEEHGIAALAYEDPELKRAGREIGREIGLGVRHMAIALGKDMVASAREVGVGVRQTN